MKEVKIPIGTIRIKKNLKTYIKTKNSWKQSKEKFPEIIQIAKLFKSNNNFNELIDKKNPEFLKGQIYKNKIQGARINILPNGKKLDKAYSLFSPNLTIHNQITDEHWDVIYQNPNGEFAYCYTIDKKQKAVRKKYKKVKEFEKVFERLNRQVSKALKDKKDYMALPMQTLLTTCMRVGNEIYYNNNKHKGLTTLKKKDISIKNNQVEFNYLGKDGVPIKIKKQFSTTYITRLKNQLKRLKKHDFVFTNPNTNHPLKDTEFKKAFKKYCGKEFYPHIVRSYYATKQAEEFLKENKKPNKKEVKELFNNIAEELGHKKFDKKNNQWKDSYTVTIHHYINPILVEKIQNKIKTS